MKEFFRKHKKAIGAVVLILSLVVCNHFRILSKDKKMREEVRHWLDEFISMYQDFQEGKSDVDIEELYEEHLTYSDKLSRWYFYCEEHDLFSRSSELTESWMTFGQLRNEMQAVFLELMDAEDVNADSFRKKVDNEHFQVMKRGIDYLEEGHFYITFDSYNRIQENGAKWDPHKEVKDESDH